MKCFAVFYEIILYKNYVTIDDAVWIYLIATGAPSNKNSNYPNVTSGLGIPSNQI